MDDGVTLRPPPVCTGRGGRLFSHGVRTADTPCSLVLLHAPVLAPPRWLTASVLAATKNTRAREFPDGGPRQKPKNRFGRDAECYDCRLVYFPSSCTGHVKVTATAKKY